MGHHPQIEKTDSAPSNPKQNGNANTQTQQDNFQIQIPTITLPKGGGALDSSTKKITGEKSEKPGHAGTKS